MMLTSRLFLTAVIATSTVVSGQPELATFGQETSYPSELGDGDPASFEVLPVAYADESATLRDGDEKDVPVLLAYEPGLATGFEQETAVPSLQYDYAYASATNEVIAYNTLDDGDQPTTFGDEQCPLVLGCCEEDCCGEGTSWQSPFCILDRNSSGFNGTYLSAWKEGCIARICCENECCSPETKYDNSNAACVPKDNAQKSASDLNMPIRPPESTTDPTDQRPMPVRPTEPTGGVGTTKIDGECNSNEDCDSGYCYLGLGSPGTCSCNPDTNYGCYTDYECAGTGQLAEAQGIAFIVEPRPECLLSHGAACSPGESKCVSGLCDKKTLTCGCNSFTSYPCDAKNGETCIFFDDSYVCSGGLVGEGATGEPCFDNEDCDTGWCEIGGYMIPGSPGYCSCNPKTNIGCEGDFVCVSGGELMNAQFIADAGSGCYLPNGATCDPTEKGCLSMNCDETTRQCACSTFTNYPCKPENGEVCVLDENNTYGCQLENPQIGKPPILDCPKPSGVCTTEYAPVVCDGCEYSNKCLASSTGFAFDFCEHVLDPIPVEPPPILVDPEATGEPAGGTGLVKIDGDCKGNKDCDSGYCFLIVGSGSPGTCSCNPEKNVGCAAEYVCAGGTDISDAQGLQYFAEPKPECLLPFGAACSPNDPGTCLTGVCDYSTNTCGCNSLTSYPCDTQNGEACLLLDGSSVCMNGPLGGDVVGGMQAPEDVVGGMQAPEDVPVGPTILTGEGPFEIGQPCIVDGDCLSGSCFYGFRSLGSPGECSCHPETNAGCPSGFECASSGDLEVTQRIADASPGCYLPHGAACDPTEYNCLSGTCDKKTLQCACNTFSNYPCADQGKVCIVNGDNIHVCE